MSAPLTTKPPLLHVSVAICTHMQDEPFQEELTCCVYGDRYPVVPQDWHHWVILYKVGQQGIWVWANLI